MERVLYEASLSGNVGTLNTLIQKDPLILDRVTVTCLDNETPLHVAALRGHLDFTRAILSLNPNLAIELNSFGHSPLHLASVKGHAAIVKELLRASIDVCLVRDHDGRIPLHLAAIKGRIQVIQELILARPESIRERVDRGETVFHLCVRHNRLEALKLLVESVSDHELVNSMDNDGNTILHVSASLKHIEIIKYLLSRRDVKERASSVNGNGFTALDVLEHCPRGIKDMEIRDILVEASVQRGKGLKITVPPPARPPPLPAQSPSLSKNVSETPKRMQKLVSEALKVHHKADSNWLVEARSHLMVTATMIATVAFQTGMNPPGGVVGAQLLSKNQNQTIGFHAGINLSASGSGTHVGPKSSTKPHHQAVTPVLNNGNQEDKTHSIFLSYNMVLLVASLSIILIMISGFPLKNKVATWLMMIVTSVAVSFMALTYFVYLDILLTPDKDWDTVDAINKKSVATCFGVFVIVILLHSARILSWLVIKLREFIYKRWLKY